MINGQVITINTLQNLVGKLLSEANKIMSNQLLLGFQIAWIGQVIAESNIADKENEDNVGYSFLLDVCNEFHCHGQDDALPSHGGGTHLRVSPSQVAES
jgi:hypothetical protein